MPARDGPHLMPRNHRSLPAPRPHAPMHDEQCCRVRSAQHKCNARHACHSCHTSELRGAHRSSYHYWYYVTNTGINTLHDRHGQMLVNKECRVDVWHMSSSESAQLTAHSQSTLKARGTKNPCVAAVWWVLEAWGSRIGNTHYVSTLTHTPDVITTQKSQVINC